MNILHSCLYAMVLIMGLTHDVYASSMSDGIKAYNENDMDRAESYWKPLSRQGNIAAKYNLWLLQRRKNDGQSNNSAYLIATREAGLIDSYLLSSLPEKNNVENNSAEKNHSARQVEEKALQNPRVEELSQQDDPFSRSYAWYLSLPSDQLTIQLLNSKDEASLLRYIEKHNIADKARVFKIIKRSKLQYVLVYGNYDSKSNAENDLNTLPDNLRKWNPWIRPLSSINPVDPETENDS